MNAPLRYICLVFIAALFHVNLFAQHKTYKGPYAGGIAEYTYYSNQDMTRNFDGEFKFTTGENDGLFIKGRYINNMKDGQWSSNLWGFNETVNYKHGLKHGSYKLSYEADNIEITIDAKFSDGDIDTLYYRSNDPKFGIISGSFNRNGDGIWVQGIGQIMYAQFFHKNVLIGTMTQDMSSGDTNNTLEAISAIRNVVEEIGNVESFSVDNSHYRFVPITGNSLNRSDTDILSAKFNYLHERALFFLYDYHFSMWHIDLTRGEVFQNYIMCYVLEPDEKKNREESNRRIQANAQEERKQAELRQEQDLFATKFYQTEYGKAVQYLQQYINLPDEQYENKVAEYFTNLLSKFKPKSTGAGMITSDKTKTLNAVYTEEHPYLTRELNQRYVVLVPADLENSYILAVPTKLGLKGENLCVVQAIIFYFNNDDQQLKLYLQYHQDEISIWDKANAGVVCNSSHFSIKEDGNNYIATYFGKENAVRPADLQKKNKKGCFYLIWNDIDLVNRGLSKEEVQKPIEERFNTRYATNEQWDNTAKPSKPKGGKILTGNG